MAWPSYSVVAGSNQPGTARSLEGLSVRISRGSLVQDPTASGRAPFRLHVGCQLVWLADEAAIPAMLGTFALVMRHRSRLVLSPAAMVGFAFCGWVQVGRYHRDMAHATKLTKVEVERRRAAAERMRGLFADVAPDRSLVDELITDRRAEAAAESGESAIPRRRGG